MTINHDKIIREFVMQVDNLMIYGAGKYGRYMLTYLRTMKIDIVSFVVSDGEVIQERQIDGISVKHISEIANEGKNVHIILAMQEKYHPEVISKLEEMGQRDCLCLPNSFYRYELWFFLQCPLMTNEFFVKNFFEMQARDFFKKYEIAEFSIATVSRFGPMMFLWIQKFLEKRTEDTYQVLIPDFIVGEISEDILTLESTGNSFFYQKLKQKNCFITNENKFFWRFLLDNYPEKVIFNSKYDLPGMGEFQHRFWKNKELDSSFEYFILNKSEMQHGSAIAKNIGIYRKYVCFSARNNRYFYEKGLNKGHLEAQSNQRNCSLKKFRKMCDFLDSQGLQSVRMGYLCEDSIRGNGIVDYASFFHNDFMDYYLIAKCEFVVCQFSGFHFIPILFNKPTLLTDSICFTVQGDLLDLANPNQDIMLMKKIRSPYTGEYMSLREILHIEEKFPNIFERTNYYKENGYEFVENSSEEILSAAQEMLGRLRGEISYDKDYYEIQKEIRMLRKKSIEKSGNFGWNIPFAESFIKKNKWLLS